METLVQANYLVMPPRGTYAVAQMRDGLIVLIDQEPTVRAALALCLRAEGHMVCVCASLAGAAVALRDLSRPVRIVIFACDWPSGADEAVNVVRRSRHEGAAIIVLCDDPDPPDRMDGNISVVYRLTSPANLMAMVDEILEPPLPVPNRSQTMATIPRISGI